MRTSGSASARSGATADGVELTTADGETRRFDRAVVATHADQALGLLADPSPAEQSALGAFRYTANETVLHTDERFLPRARAARASWNYQVNGALKPTVTYYLNRLQRLEADEHFCVTLNRTHEIDPERVIMRTVYDHPLYTLDTLRGQQEVAALNGERHTLYAGAHLGNGFHEDGLASAVRAAAQLGVDVVKSALYTGTLIHSRRTPARNTFRYPISFFVLDLDELPALERRLALFSVNRPNLVTLRDEDHFDGTQPGEGGRRPLLRRARRRGRARADAGAAPRPRLRLQPGQLPLVLRARRTAGLHDRRAQQHLRRAAARAPARPRRSSTRTTSGCTSRRSSGSTSTTSTRSRSRRTRSGRGVHVRENGHVPLSAVLHGHRQELTNATPRRGRSSATRSCPCR